MTNALLTVNGANLRGLIQAVEPYQIGEPFIMNGRNFVFDAKGPKSAFGRRFLSYQRFYYKNEIRTFRINDEYIIIATEQGFFRYDTVSDTYYPVFIPSTTATERWPWTMARVGGRYYFARKGFNLIEFDFSDNRWTEITTNVPTGCFAVCEAGGRLIILGDDRVARSNIDDGADLASSSTTGAGFQLTSLIGGVNLALMPTTDGYLVYTSKGIMKAQLLVGLATPFRHDVLSGQKHAIIGPHAVTELETNQHVFLTKTGFYITDGNSVEPWQPLMGEYFKQTYLPNFDLDIPGTIKLFYYPDRDWFFVMISSSTDPGRYYKAYVLYIPRDAWSMFNKNFIALGELNLTQGPREGFNFGYICSVSGCMYELIDFPYIEIDPTWTDYYHRHLDFQPDGYIENTAGTDTWIAETWMNLWTFDERIFPNESGLYQWDYTEDEVVSIATETAFDEAIEGSGLWEDYLYLANSESEDYNSGSGIEDYMDGTIYYAGTAIELYTATKQIKSTIYEPSFSSVDSYIEIGLFNYSQQQHTDEVATILELALGVPDLPSGVTVEDYNLGDTPDEDYNLTSNDEDYGQNTFDSSKFALQITGTYDGETVFYENQSVPSEEIVKNERRFYSTECAGILHKVKISALEDEQSFHLKLLTVSGNLSGRI